MNGFFIWNLFMTLICAFNFYSISRNEYAPAWAKVVVFFAMIVVMAFTAMTYKG